MVSWLVPSCPDRAGWVHTLDRDIALRSSVNRFTPTVPLSIQVWKRILVMGQVGHLAHMQTSMKLQKALHTFLWFMGVSHKLFSLHCIYYPSVLLFTLLEALERVLCIL